MFKQDAVVVQEMLNLQIADITLDSMEPPELYMDESYTEKVTDRVQINKDSVKIGKLYYATSKEKGCIVFGREAYANIKQVTEVATNETVAIENIVYRYTEEDLPTYKDKSIKWYVTSTNRVVLEAGDIIVDGDDENNGETGDEIEDDTSVIAEPGIYKMTVNAGTVASWLGIEVKELNIPEGASIEYSFEASDDNITYDAAVSNIEQVRKSQYLRVRLILTSNEKNECPSFRSVRVKFNIGDEIEVAAPVLEKVEEVEYTGQTMYKLSEGQTEGKTTEIIDFGENYSTTNKGESTVTVPVVIGNETNYLTVKNPSVSGATLKTYVSQDNNTWTETNNISGYRYVKTETIVTSNDVLVGKVQVDAKTEIAETEVEWITYKTEYYETDAGKEGEWISIETDEVVPEGTRIIYSFSKSNNDSTWTKYNDDITANGNSRYLSVKVVYQKQGKDITQLAKLNDIMVVYKVDNVINYGGLTNNKGLVQIIKETDIKDNGLYQVNIKDESYTIHTYVYNGNQTWDSMTFGNADDVGASGKYAQNMVVVKVNGNLTINSGATITAYNTTYGGPKGMLLCVTGTLINNGTISMSSRGAYAEGQNVYLWKNSNGSYEYVPAVGAAGGTGTYNKSSTFVADAGDNGTNRQTGGGGAGSSFLNNGKKGGNGASGTSYSGGSGGGAGGKTGHGGNAKEYGGAGGAGASSSGGGGAGNPGSWRNGGNGTGGLLIIYAKQFNNTANILSNGAKGGNAYSYGGSGAGSGGGSINIFYETLVNKGEINSNGGSGATYSSNNCGKGGTGGVGSKSIGNISSGTYVEYTGQ